MGVVQGDQDDVIDCAGALPPPLLRKEGRDMKIYITIAKTDETIAVYRKESNGRYTCLTGYVQDSGEWLTVFEEKALPVAAVAEQITRLKSCEDYSVRYEWGKHEN